MRVFPRLDSAVATELLGEYSNNEIATLSDRAACSHPRVTWYPTAPERVSEEQLTELRQSVLTVARQFGHPRLLGQRAPEYVKFDRSVGLVMLAGMEIVPADAANEGVWSFISLVLLPDVSLWRFPNRDRREDYERILGRPRNVFRRLWWRCFALGNDPEGPATGLLEDEAVGIFERPTLGGDPRVAKAIAVAHLEHVVGRPSLSRTEVMRQATKRLRRLASVISLSALDDSTLRATIDAIFDTATIVVERSGAPPLTDAQSA